MGMQIYLDGFTSEEVDQINMRNTYRMLGIDPEAERRKAKEAKAKAEAEEKAAQAEKLHRFMNAVSRLNKIRSGEERSDIRKGSMIKIDGFVFTI